MMRVFSDEYVQSLKKRYEQKPDFEKPDIYFIGVSDGYQYLRDEIEEMVAVLLQDEQEEVISRLKAKDNFIQTYNELVVGCLLRQFCDQVEHGKEFKLEHKKLTPDWYIPYKGNTSAFIVEVFTTDSGRNKRSTEDWQVKDLERRISKIPIDATLSIRLDASKADSGLNKLITQEINRWLTQKNPSVGTQYSGNGFKSEIVKRNTGLPEVKPIFARNFLLVDTEHLRNTINHKIEKYKKLEMPLVVAVVTDPILGEKLRNILVGGRGIEEYYNPSTGVIERTTFLLNDGLFIKQPDLSAVVWVSRTWSGWKMMAIYNPTAKRQLHADTFGENHCPIYELTPAFGD